MARIKSVVVKEVEVVQVICDLCGSTDTPRCSCNRVCERCGRDTCGKCQVDEEFSTGPECIRCAEFRPTIGEEINAHYRAIEELRQSWKVQSLTSAAAGKEER
jgi:hypothetical protein